MKGSSLFRSDYAVSEIVGGIILVVVAVAVFSVIYFDVMSKDVDVYQRNVNIQGSVSDEGLVLLEHMGGDDIDSYSVYVYTADGDFIGSKDCDDSWSIGECKYPLDGISDMLLDDETDSVKIIVYTENEDSSDQKIFEGELFGKVNPLAGIIPPDEGPWDPSIPLLISSLRNNTVDEDLVCYSLPTNVNMTPTPDFYDTDVDMDWQIDSDDVDSVNAVYGSSGTPGWIREDVNDDGVIDDTDVDLVQSDIGTTQLTYIYNWMVNGESITDLLLTFDKDNISNEVKDYSGNEFDGTVFGPDWSSEGVIGGSCIFDGFDDYVSLPYCFDNNYIDDLTIETWVKCYGDSAVIASFGNGDYWELGTLNGKIRWSSSADGDNVEIYGNTDISDLNWHYVVITYDSSTGNCAIYIDGQLDVSENIHNPGDLLGDGTSPNGFIGTSDSTIQGSWDLLTYDDFEEGFDSSSYTDGGRDCKLYTGGTYAHQGDNAANIQDNNGDRSSFYHTNGINVDASGYTSIKVDFWFIANSMEYGEDFWVKYYDGNDWIKVADYDRGDEFENNEFYHEIVWINETDYTFPSDMKIRFQCDASWDYDDIYIDEVYVNATIGDIEANNYSGKIDEFRIYNRVLSADQVYQNFLCMNNDFSDISVIVSDETSLGDIWKCEMTPNDGNQDGDTVLSETLPIVVYGGG